MPTSTLSDSGDAVPGENKGHPDSYRGADFGSLPSLILLGCRKNGSDCVFTKSADRMAETTGAVIGSIVVGRPVTLRA